MGFLLFPDPAVFFGVIGHEKRPFPPLHQHIRPDGSGVNEGKPGLQKRRVEADFCRQAVKGGVSAVAGENRLRGGKVREQLPFPIARVRRQKPAQPGRKLPGQRQRPFRRQFPELFDVKGSQQIGPFRLRLQEIIPWMWPSVRLAVRCRVSCFHSRL